MPLQKTRLDASMAPNKKAQRDDKNRASAQLARACMDNTDVVAAVADPEDVDLDPADAVEVRELVDAVEDPELADGDLAMDLLVCGCQSLRRRGVLLR